MKGWVSFNDAWSLKTGKGRSIAKYGELFQGQIEDGNNQPHECLMSLPSNAMYSEVTFRPDTSGSLRTNPAYKTRARNTVTLTLAHLNASGIGGEIYIESEIPEGKGCGSSTADCIAAAMAAADAIGTHLSEDELARLVVEAQATSENFMFRRAVLFARREGVIWEDYSRRLPTLEVLGIDTSPHNQKRPAGSYAVDYSWKHRQIFYTLTGALRRAIRKEDRRLLGRVATASANVNQEFLPKPMFSEIRGIAERAQALGVAVAHSGTVLSILLDPSDELLEWKVDRIRAQFNTLGVSQMLRFQT